MHLVKDISTNKRKRSASAYHSQTRHKVLLPLGGRHLNLEDDSDYCGHKIQSEPQEHLVHLDHDLAERVPNFVGSE